MKRNYKYFLIGSRETSLVAFAIMSVYLSYMLAECMMPIIRYYMKADLVLTESEFVYLYIIPSMVLSLDLYYFIRRYDKISFKILIPIQILFFSVFHIVLLLFAGDRLDFYWYPWGNKPLPEYFTYHTGLRYTYTDIAVSSKEFYGSYEIWIQLGIVLLLLIGFAVLYRFLLSYIKTRNKSTAFAEPIHQK